MQIINLECFLDIGCQNNMTTWDNLEKPGFANGGWDYDETNLSYDEDIDPDTQLSVTYNGLGTAVSWSNQTKS